LKNIQLRLKLENLAAIPVEIAPIPIDVAVFAAQFFAFVASGGVIPAVEIATQLATIMCDLSLVVTDIAVQASVTIPGERRRHTHSQQQENPSNCAFHIFCPPTAIRGYRIKTPGARRSFGEEDARWAWNACNPSQEADIWRLHLP
jgi:hypothetical protein